MPKLLAPKERSILKRALPIAAILVAVVLISGTATAASTNGTSTLSGSVIVHRYAPSPMHVYDATVYDPPVQPIDADNLSITFTLPATGDVLVRLKAWQDVQVGSMLWGLLENGQVVPGSTGVVDRSNTQGSMTEDDILLTSVSAGTHTYVWGWSNAVHMRLIVGDGTTQDAGEHIWSPALMEVLP